MIELESESTAGFPWPSLDLYPERLAYAMERARLTQAELARAINANRTVINNMHSRPNRLYRGRYLRAIASALDAPVDWLSANAKPGHSVAHMRRDRIDSVDDLAAVVTRLLAKKLMSESELVALTSMLRIREDAARDGGHGATTPAVQERQVGLGARVLESAW